VEATDSNLPEYTAELIAETATAEKLSASSNTVLFPEENQKLSAAIALVKASYKIPTSIGSITIDEIKEDDNIYNINGQKVKEFTPGNIYIINRKKVRVTK
jgi:hypothetical protein